MSLVWWCVLCLVLAGCTAAADRSVMNLAQSLNEANISNCTLIQVAVPPYGNAVIYARAGDLDCVTLWRLRMQVGP
jgi:hypothetical protein